MPSKTPVVDGLRLSRERNEKTVKKANRMMLQRLSANDMLMHFFDVHQVPEDPGYQVESWLTPIEVAEISHHEMARKLLQLAVACRSRRAPGSQAGSLGGAGTRRVARRFHRVSKFRDLRDFGINFLAANLGRARPMLVPFRPNWALLTDSGANPADSRAIWGQFWNEFDQVGRTRPSLSRVRPILGWPEAD